MKPSDFANVLQKYVKPQTFPLGFKLVRDLSEVPERARRFDNITICQGYNLARYYRWTVFLNENTVCPIGLILYGLAKPDELYSSGELAVAGGYADNTEIGKKFEESIVGLDFGKYAGILVFPLERDEAEPDFAVIHGMPAQILRFVHAVLYDTGGALETRILGRASCSEYLEAFIEKKPRFVLTCYGERVFGLTQDYEVSFAFPWEMAERIARNLEKTHRKGIRFPVPLSGLRSPPVLPEKYAESLENIRKSDHS